MTAGNVNEQEFLSMSVHTFLALQEKKTHKKEPKKINQITKKSSTLRFISSFWKLDLA